MKPLILHLRQKHEPIREPAAWFIAGASAAEWLEEIIRWSIPQDKLKLFIIPRSVADRSVAGVLVVPLAGVEPRCFARALPFGVLAGKMYLPVDAELWPPVEPAELTMPHEVLVFHPGIGLIGFDSSEAMKISDLLRQSPSRVENWNSARAGIGFNTRLRAVTVIAPVSPADLFGDAANEIGSDPITDLPAAPDEPGESALDKLRRSAEEKLAGFLSSVTRLVPHTGSRRTWINDLEAWAASRLQQLTSEIEALRHKELNRLLHQLENDPESGLRHAIPLGQISHRGLAPPGGRLNARIPNFNLGNLRGGRGADFWDIPFQIRQQLTARYRELANRELQLGRYRRAAYIFAELLGDLEAAASALKQGRHFREAATVYLEHLRRPREAALCLAEGGLFSEAVDLYEKESCFLEAGDLWSRLGQAEPAAAAYRREVEKLLKRDDRISAARLLEEKLASPDEALTLLTEGWPHSTQALQCLGAQFAFLSRNGRHADSVTLLGKLRAEQTRPHLISGLAHLLAGQCAKYPDQSVRRAAADLTRVKVSERLDVAVPAEAVLLSDALVKLAPEDRLLARDAVRFVAQRNDQFRRRPVATPARTTSAPVLLQTHQLSKAIQWHAIKSCGSGFITVGHYRDKLIVEHGNWNGNFQTLNWPCADLQGRPLVLELDESESQPSSVAIMIGDGIYGWTRVPEQAFAASNPFPWVMRVGTPDWIPNDFLAVSQRGNLAWLVRRTLSGLVLACHKSDGAIVATIGLNDETLANESLRAPLSLLTQRKHNWIAAGRELFLQRPGRPLANWHVESDVLSLIDSAPHLPLCALARLQNGVAIQWLEALQENVEILCPELASPLAAFTGNGSLVLLSHREGRIGDVTRHGAQFSPFIWPGEEPIAVVRAQAANEFAVFTRSGQVQLFRIHTSQ